MLTGKVICGECINEGKDVSYKQRKPKQGGYYKFYKHNWLKSELGEGDKCCNSTISQEAVEQFVLDRIADVALSEDQIMKQVEAYNNYRTQQANNVDEVTKLLRKKIIEIEAKIDAATDQLLVPENAPYLDKIRKKLSEFENQKANFQRQLSQEIT